MTHYHLEPSLVPRNGRVLRVIGITRISTLNQDPKSLGDQQALLRQWVEDRYDGPVEWISIAGQGSGECVDRQQVAQAEELVETSQYDLVIMEDLARHMRRVHAVLFCEQCEDSETRLIAINDNVDTCKEWRLHAFFATMKHEQCNKDTSERIKRSLRNRFMQGEVVQCPIFGYIKPPGTKNDGELQKNPAAEPIFREWFRRVDEGATYSEIADWLNEQGVSPGPCCRLQRWNCAMVGRIMHTPILKGIRVRNKMKSKRTNKSGRYKSVKASPEERLERSCPHLAFFEAAYYDRVIAKVDARNSKYRRTNKGGPDPVLNRPRKRVRFPGQCIYCGVCGRLFVFGGHGRKDSLMCSGARDHKCWNGATVDGPLATAKISEAIWTEIEALDGFDATLLEMVKEEACLLDTTQGTRLHELTASLEKLDREIANLMKFIRDGDNSPRVHAEMLRLENEHTQVQCEKELLEQRPTHEIILPTADEVKRVARQAIQGLATDSYEFAKAMRTVVGRIFVFPHQLCDGGDVVLRAKVRLQVANLLPDKRLQEVLARPLERKLILDLFPSLPQRVAYREEIVAHRAGGETEREVARALGITQPAVQRATALDRLMQRLGLTDPYVRLIEPPLTACGKLHRHLHPRYQFEPLLVGQRHFA